MLFVVNNKLKLAYQSVSVYLVIAVIYGLGYLIYNKIELFGCALANRFDLIFACVGVAYHFSLSLCWFWLTSQGQQNWSSWSGWSLTNNLVIVINL